MLIIKHYGGAIFLSKEKEFCIYDELFSVDEKGKRVQDGGVDYNADLVIETQTKRYRFKEVSPESFWARKLADYVAEHIHEDTCIDIHDALDEEDECFEYGEFKTECIL